MSSYKAEIVWHSDSEEFLQGLYSRAHLWRFDGGIEVKASASPQVVRAPFSIAEAVDPEEAFVASLSSCHMLWFLSLAARHKFIVEKYLDQAVGEMGKDELGREWMARVVLHPQVQFASSASPSGDELGRLHESAHEHCFLANSVKTEVVCEPCL